MNILNYVLIAVGLSMDSFSVSVANGMYYIELKLKKALLICFLFAFIQSGFALIGWATGSVIVSFFKDFDHWIAFILLLIIGLKMLFERHEIKALKPSLYGFFLQAIATSIDALIIGFSFAALGGEMWLFALFIAFFTFLFVCLGLFLGKKMKKKFNFRTGLIGGLILIAIGFKILIEHLNDHYWHLF